MIKMEITELLSKIEELEEDIEDLKANLQPLLNGALSETIQKLPVLDRAKLYVVVVYAIESLIFCTMRHRLAKACLTRVQAIYVSMESKLEIIQSSPSLLASDSTSRRYRR